VSCARRQPANRFKLSTLPTQQLRKWIGKQVPVSIVRTATFANLESVDRYLAPNMKRSSDEQQRENRYLFSLVV
jgi:hypothetical protein